MAKSPAETSANKDYSDNCPLPETVDWAAPHVQGSWSNVRSWCSEMVLTADRCNIDIELLAALTLWESGGDNDAISHAGAVGLTQVMPRDGIAASFMCLNGPCFKDRPTTEELKNPQTNLDFGGCLLSGLVSDYGLRDGLTKYSGGYYYYQYADPIAQIYKELSASP